VTIPQADAPVYTDLKGLTALKRGAASHDPAAIRKVAQQFESMFTRMMLKSMRDASGKDPMFGSDQAETYQSMADDQLAVQLSKGKGFGLADMLIRQLQKMGVKGADAAGANGLSGPGAAGDGSTSIRNFRGGLLGGPKGAAAYSATQRSSASVSSVSDTDKANFVRDVLPHAQEAGRQLGVDPGSLIAQAALETNWGRNLPQDATGRSSNNLFGIKASSAWTGPTVTSGTQEYQGGVATSTSSQFKAYATPAQSFQDYVSLLRDNPRYSAALNTGSNVQAFATGLQRGGYATDPEYAGKIVAIAHKINGTLASRADVSDLKLASAPPITAKTGTF
jgi:peptidoglycan hydrolase FlgJ